jgi:hypothetical protein
MLSGPRSLHHLIDVSISREGSHCCFDWLTQGIPTRNKSSRARRWCETGPLRRFRQRLLSDLQQTASGAEGEKPPLARSACTGRAAALGLPVASVWVVANILLFALNSLGQLPPLGRSRAALYAVLFL